MNYKWYRISPKVDNAAIYDQYGLPIGRLFGEWDVKGVPDPQKLFYYYFDFAPLGFPSGYVRTAEINITKLENEALKSDEAQIAITNLYAQVKSALTEAAILTEKLEDLAHVMRQYLDIK